MINTQNKEHIDACSMADGLISLSAQDEPEFDDLGEEHMSLLLQQQAGDLPPIAATDDGGLMGLYEVLFKLLIGKY